MKNSNVVGIDLAKHVIQVCKIDQHGELISNKAISPSKLKELLAKTVPSIAAMEGCGACLVISGGCIGLICTTGCGLGVVR